MDNVQIQILDSANNIEGVLEIGEIANFGLALSNSIADLTDIDKSNGSYALPFKVPSTKANDDLLEHIYLSQHKNYKDFDAEKDCKIIVNDNDIDSGVVRIKKIKRVGRTQDDYSFTFFGDNMDWVLKLKTKTTQDLPYLDNTFTYGQAEQIASWSNSGGSEQPVYSVLHRGGRLINGQVSVLDLFPDYFAIDYLNNAFKSIGYNFDSTFLSASDKANLYIPFFGTNFKDTDRSIANVAIAKMDNSATNFDNTFTIDGTSTGLQIDFDNKLVNYQGATFTSSNGVVDFATETKVADYIDTPAPLKDTGSNFATNQYTVPYNANFLADGILDYTVTYNPNDIWNSYEVHHRLKVTRGLGSFYLYVYTTNKTSTITTISGSRESERVTANFTTNWSYLQAGDKLELTYRFFVRNPNSPPTTHYFSLSHQNNPITFKPSVFFQEDDNFNWKTVSDDKISLLDMVSDIGKAFNIYWRTNRATKTVYAEPRDDFYNALSTAENYTDRIDESKKIDISYNSSYYNRTHNFNYKEDSNDDYLNERNKDLEDKWCGYSHYYPDKFKSGSSNVETKTIAATYTIEDIYSGGDFAFYTSRLWNDEDTPELSTKFAPRLLYFNYSTQQTIDGNSCNFQYESESSKRSTIPYGLPFPVVVEGVTLADVDGVLSFKDVDGSNGLWTNHYSTTAKEIEEGKRISINFKFDLVDYNDLDFRKPIYIDNRYPEVEGYWRIEKVKNFKPTSKAISVSFELIQAKNFGKATTNSQSPVQSETATDVGNLGYGKVFPFPNSGSGNASNLPNSNIGNNNSYENDSNTVVGNNLRVSGSNQLVLGTYNVDVSTDLFQLGTGSNESNRNSLIRVDRDGNTYFNGALLPPSDGEGTVVTITSDTTADENVSTYLVDTTSDITITFETPTTIGKTWNCKKINASNTMILIGGSDGAGGVYEVDGDVAGASVTALNDNIPIKWCGIIEQFKII